ncbi:hypothetical protein GCM10018781_80900 [Kitasatospora indigofera]|uniref:Uncharacterized protein n=1 Tax=Kitasatospora indigofera TaxID=67307 RepID=A0A919DAZ6_9ACTN|nr:hypothetical protein [Kitasatospora indigofera]GHE28850.1 hypothetical protein GCM10018781_80900 [Kitasatospora indigofera]
MTTTHPYSAPPVPDVLPAPEAVLRRSHWPSLQTACGTGRTLPEALARLLDPDLNASDTRDALGDLEPVRHQNSLYEATAPVALFVAALLSRRTAQHGGATADEVSVLLLEWLADLAHDCDDARKTDGDRARGKASLAGYPAMDNVRALRPLLHLAVAPFLDDHDTAVRDCALSAALALAEHPALAPHRDDLTARARTRLITADGRWRRRQALDALLAWGHDITDLTRPGDDRSPYITDPEPDGPWADPLDLHRAVQPPARPRGAYDALS